MKIETAFTVPVPLSQAWSLLLDVPRIVPCVPGASLTEDLGDRRYRGIATVKVGPVQLQFSGEAQISNLDETARTARVTAKGTDTKGRGNASANVNFVLKPDGDGTRVEVVTDLQLVGAVAQYGRATGLLKEIANQIVQQFAANLRDEIARTPNVAAVGPSLSEPSIAGPPAPADPVVTAPPSPRTQEAPARELSALGVLWSALKAIVGRWFQGRSGTAR